MFSDIKEDSTFHWLFPVSNFVIQEAYYPDYLTHLYWLVHFCLKKWQEDCFWTNFVAEEGEDLTGKENETNSEQNAKFSFQGDLHIVRICKLLWLNRTGGHWNFLCFPVAAAECIWKSIMSGPWATQPRSVLLWDLKPWGSVVGMQGLLPVQLFSPISSPTSIPLPSWPASWAGAEKEEERVI